MTLECSVSEEDGAAVVALVGELDLATADQFDETLGGLENGERDHIILDLRGLTFMDSSGLRVLAAQRLQRSTDGHECRVIALSPQVRRVLEISGLLEDLEPQADGSGD